MIALRLTVPIACWRKAHAREFLESESLPPPATCYGALLSLVGETDRARHLGCRVTAGILSAPATSLVVRTLWRIKSAATPQGKDENARPDFQQLKIGSDLVVWCDSAEEHGHPPTLEARSGIDRFGGWSLGESTHLVNDAWLLDECAPPSTCTAFLLSPSGRTSLPVWVDHVGFSGTRYAVGNLDVIQHAPRREALPKIEAGGA
jgi:CRISPR-associated protein Cas5t